MLYVIRVILLKIWYMITVFEGLNFGPVTDVQTEGDALCISTGGLKKLNGLSCKYH